MSNPVAFFPVDPDEYRRSIVDDVKRELRSVVVPQPPPLLVDKYEIARLTSTSTATIERLVADGTIPSVKFCGMFWVYPASFRPSPSSSIVRPDSPARYAIASCSGIRVNSASTGV